MSKVILVVKKGVDLEAFKTRLSSSCDNYVQNPDLPRFFTVLGYTKETFPLAEDQDVIGVDNAEDTFRLDAVDEKIPITANDSLASGGWGLARIIRRKPGWINKVNLNNQETFVINRRKGYGVDTYVLDSGINSNHPGFGTGRVFDLAGNSATNDPFGHGTATASCIGVKTCGLATGVTFWDCQISTDGSVKIDDVVAKLGEIKTHYQGRAGLNRPAVINASFGGMGWAGYATLSAAITEVIDAGLIFVAAAGNDAMDIEPTNTNNNYYPAESDPEVIAVGGTTIKDSIYTLGVRVNGSNYGPTAVDILAPSLRVRVANADFAELEDYRLWSGTSFGTPLVVGVLACMLEGYGQLTTRAEVQAIKQRLLDNATQGQYQLTLGRSMPDRIAYLDPHIAFEQIPGLPQL